MRSVSGQWERHSTLLSGLELADVTITRHDGRYYMFGAWRDGTGGYSDTLAIYYASSCWPLAAARKQPGPDGPRNGAAGGKTS